MPRMWRNPYFDEKEERPPEGDRPFPGYAGPAAAAAAAMHPQHQMQMQYPPPGSYDPRYHTHPPHPHLHHHYPTGYEGVAATEASHPGYGGQHSQPPPSYPTEEHHDSEEEEEEEKEKETTVEPALHIPQKEPRVAATTAAAVAAASEEPVTVLPAGAPRGKPEAMAIALAAATKESTMEELEAAPSPPKPKPAKKKAPPRKKLPTARPEEPRTELVLGETPEPITPEEYKNLDALMAQFCRVPLLAEFSRPVSLLHPELAASYEKIVKHPVDLGHVCRGIRRRQYKYTRDVRLDMWRVFANCVKFHSHPHNKEAVPTFVSIALHLREFFNSLWQEYMLPSELPLGASPVMIQAYNNRREERRKRIENSGVLMMSKRFLMKVAGLLNEFITSGGCVDSLDKEPIFTEEMLASKADVREVVQNLRAYKDKLEQMSANEEDHTIEEFIQKLKACYTSEQVLEDSLPVKNMFRNRLDRLVGKIYAPLHEANCRGVTQSSIWGNIATTIWARESSKKAYWPALCLGILPPEDQREGWHSAVTERNELRLPEKLRTQLMGAKRRCEAAQKKQNLSYFLVEFLGTHEFIWVRETDIVEKFDRSQDPNKMPVNIKKKRASRSSIAAVTGSKTYHTALEECEWATEEFEGVLQEAFDYESDQEGGDDGEFMNYSYALLNQSDSEASDIDDHGHVYNDDTMSLSDVDEANWLILHEGQLDTTATGRKNAKKRTQLMKRAKKESTESKKDKSGKDKSKKKGDSKPLADKKEQRELEKRRKKRTRDREKNLRDAKKSKKKRPNAEEDPRGLLFDKRRRASAIVKAYVERMASSEEYRNLALSGITNMPTSVIDSTGLLGMALAFRAASGELSMPDDSEEVDAAKFKPWTKIDCTTPLRRQERIDLLEKKVKLLENEIERIKFNTQRRRELTGRALLEKERREELILEEDKEARSNPYKKKTKPKTPAGTTSASQKKTNESPTQASVAEEDDPMDADHSEDGESAVAEDAETPEPKPSNDFNERLAAAASM